MTTINDPFPTGCNCTTHLLDQAIADGYVRRQTHPTEPLAIYTEKTTYEEAWTPVTLACRGLIHRTDTGEVVAARSLADGTFNSAGQRGAAPPSQSGQTTLALLTRINDELAVRTGEDRTAA